MLDSIFSNTTSSTDITQIILCVLTSIILGLMIAFTHKKTSKYNKNFLTTIATLPLLISTIIIMVNGNLGTSMAVLGAFGFVRFRSIPGTSKEILAVLFAMTMGLVIGMGNLMYAALIAVIGCILLFLYDRLSLFNEDRFEKVLKITIPENLDYTEVFDDIFNKYTNSVKLESVKTTNMGSMFDLKYRVNLNKNIDEKKFIDELRVKNGNLKIILTHPLEESDL